MNQTSVTNATGPVSVNDGINRTAEIIVHIDEALDSHTRHGLQAAMLNADGICSARFCPLRYHLLLVQYDRTKLNSRDVLSIVQARHCTAQLVGPV